MTNPKERKTFRLSDDLGENTDDRLRCNYDSKVVMSQRQARARVKQIRDGMEAYKCLYGFWHLGHPNKNYRRNR